MKRLIVMLLGLSGALAVSGQQAVSLEECRRLALENNKKLKMADEQIKSAKAKRQEAFTKYLPGVDAMGVYMRNQKEINLLSEDAYLPVGTVGADGKWTLRPDQVMLSPDGKPLPKDYALLPKEAMTVDDRNTALLQVGLTQPVYMGGKIRAYNQLAGLSEKLAEAGREQELQQVIQETDEAYWQIVSLANRRNLAEKFVETLKKFTRDVEVLYETGMSTKADMLSVKVKLNQAEMTLLRVEDGLALSRMALNRICGLPLDTVYVLKEELLNALPVSETSAPGIEQVYDNRPEISRLALATDIYREKEKIARSAYLPTVAFMANYIAMTPSFFDGISTKLDGMWSVGVGVKAPLFHWGAARKTVRSARAETEIMNFRLQEAKEQIELQVNQAQFKIKEAARKMQVAESNREKADENLKYACLGFQEGTIPVSNVLEAQTAWLSAHSDVIDSRIEMKLCEVYLQKAYGVLGK
ncbi:MAG: TolC family protein [Odoribacter sp.]|nr:TolC family protein [Odoribacter sp.]